MLGFFGYFRDQIPNYAEIAKPLTDLTTKRYRTTIPWESSQQKAFDDLKRGLIQATISPLYPVDFDKPMCLFVDASSFSLSGALTQINDEGKHLPVAFVSKKLNETEKKWSVIEKEAFAVIVALRKYRQWLIGSSVYVYSDHNPLSFLTESVSKNSKLMRWALALQQFSIVFHYYPGKKNVVADCLSRLPD